MATSFDIPYRAFFRKIEKDPNFFNYFNLTVDEALELAKDRANGYLIESIAKLTSFCTPTADFYNYDDSTQEFLFDLNPREIALLGSLMFEFYLEKDIGRLKVYVNHLTSQDVGIIFSPANERKEFINMYSKIQNDNIKQIKAYAARDRETGKLRKVDHAKYAEDSA